MAEYYLTTFVVEILSKDEDLSGADLKECMEEAENGAYSGDVSSAACVEVTPRQMAALLREQRSDESFLGLDHMGNELCEDCDDYPCKCETDSSEWTCPECECKPCCCEGET